MRARRVEVARRAGRKRLRRVEVGLALVCAVVWTMVGLRSSLVDVDRVQVVGAEHTTVEQVRATAATPRGGSSRSPRRASRRAIASAS